MVPYIFMVSDFAVVIPKFPDLQVVAGFLRECWKVAAYLGMTNSIVGLHSNPNFMASVVHMVSVH